MEEVGKIIFDVLNGPVQGLPSAWHLKKQRCVGLIIAAHVCAVAVGDEVLLPRSDETAEIDLDDELTRMLYDEPNEPGVGKELGRYLWAKSGGRADADAIRQCGEYEHWLLTGYLNSIKNAGFYCDLSGAHITIDESMSKKVVDLARNAVQMCAKL